jgi:HEAT repeat protein
MLGDTPSAPAIRAWLTHPDEDFRGVAAEAFSGIGDKESIEALEAALRAEPFPWVREQITASLAKLKN